MSKVLALELKKDQYSMWDNLVENSPQGTIFQTSSWLNSSAEHLNMNFRIIGCFEGDNLIAGCPLYTYSLRRFLKIASSHCPTTPYGGVVISKHLTSKSNAHIIGLICSLLSEEEFDHIELIHSPDFSDIRPFLWNGWKSSVLYTHIIDIDIDLRDKIAPKKRKAIKQATEQGIIIRKSNDSSSFYKLYTQTLERQKKSTSVPRSFFDDLIKSVCSKESGCMWIAEMPSGEIASSEIVVWDNNRAYSIFSASNTKLRNTNSNALLINEIYEDLRERGFKEWNHMMANVENLSRYMSQFGTRLTPYYGVENSSLCFNLIKDIISLIKFF